MGERIKIVVAETSPVILTGMSGCLRRISTLHLQVMEARTLADLKECISSVAPDLVIVNPTFCGGFNPASIRHISGNDIKMVAIETGKLDAMVTARYDGVISIVDDMETIAAKISSLFNKETDVAVFNDSKDRESLSNREKEIVSFVVKGFTNKEIADKLFLSVHTVITHRRNIARKLDIHSPTGLTIYAIVNKLVDLGEIRL